MEQDITKERKKEREKERKRESKKDTLMYNIQHILRNSKIGYVSFRCSPKECLDRLVGVVTLQLVPS